MISLHVWGSRSCPERTLVLGARDTVMNETQPCSHSTHHPVWDGYVDGQWDEHWSSHLEEGVHISPGVWQAAREGHSPILRNKSLICVPLFLQGCRLRISCPMALIS